MPYILSKVIHTGLSQRPNTKIIMLPVVLYGCEAWALRLRWEYRLSVLKTGSRGEYFGVRGMRMGSGFTVKNFIVCTVHLK